jgi:hypothetical protein
MLNRRDFLKTAAAGTAAGLVNSAPERAAAYRHVERLGRIGVALFTIRSSPTRTSPTL